MSVILPLRRDGRQPTLLYFSTTMETSETEGGSPEAEKVLDLFVLGLGGDILDVDSVGGHCGEWSWATIRRWRDGRTGAETSSDVFCET